MAEGHISIDNEVIVKSSVEKHNVILDIAKTLYCYSTFGPDDDPNKLAQLAIQRAQTFYDVAVNKKLIKETRFVD